jgi:hypothetical protein
VAAVTFAVDNANMDINNSFFILCPYLLAMMCNGIVMNNAGKKNKIAMM